MAIPASSRRRYLKLVNKPVLVVWHDAASCSSGWQTIEDLKAEKLPLMRSVAWLIHISDDAAHLATDLNEKDKGVAGTGVIPLVWITEMQELGTEQ